MTRAPASASAALGGDPLWYKDAVIYEAHVRSFRDSNCDGIGDFRGLVEKLDYIEDLGVTALWLLPFYPSPLRDDGYDISDYRRVHPSYGTLRDFRTLLAEAHTRNIRVITELVLAHTSDQHPWFRRARSAEARYSQRDFYVWSDTPDRYSDARVIFTDFENSNWTYDPVAEAYYWHRFYSHQPSLNYDNPEVRAAMLDVVDFWLELGVDGLRLDAVPYLYAREHTICENLPETFEFLKALRRHVDERFEGRMLLAEANQWPEDATAYFAGGDGCQMAFHFPLMPRMFMAARQEDRFPIVDILTETPVLPANCQWALFLRNHDELTLEMVTDEERDYMYRSYADDPQARVNVGIRRRLAPLLGNDRKLIEMMNGLLFSLPGTPIIYYGDEIGMGDNIYLGDRNAVRTPMQWDGDRNAGFSEANPQRLYLPVIIDPEYHVQAVNVASQQENPNSLLWWMRRLVALRNRHRAFARGSFELLLVDNRKVLAFLRRDEEETILVLVNLSRFAQCVELDLSEFVGRIPTELFGGTEFPAVGDLPYFITLGGHGFYWFSVHSAEERAEGALPEIGASNLAGVFSGPRQSELERALVRHISSARWFQDKSRLVRRAEVVDHFNLSGSGAADQIAVVELSFDHGAPERYVVPLAAAEAERAEELRRFHRESVVAEMSGGAVLYDATLDPAFGPALINLLRRRQLGAGEGRLVGTSTPALRRAHTKAHTKSDVGGGGAVIGGDHSNTSLLVDGSVVIKLLRRIEGGINPDVEVGRFLTERARFAHSPSVLGSLDYESDGQPSTVAVFGEFIANEGDGWNYVLDALRHGLEESLADPDAHALRLPPPISLLDLSERLPDPGSFLLRPHQQWAELLGRRTAELHLALCSDGGGDPSFHPTPLTAIDRQAMLHSARGLWRRSIRSLRPAADHNELLAAVLNSEAEILERLEVIRSLPIEVTKIRIHGDFHLGQVLWTGKDFAVIDFEGEPARSIATRRLKRSALVDVAGMVRSFHYVARVAASRLELETPGPREHDVLERLLTYWYRFVAGTYLASYREAAGDAPFMPADREELGALLEFALLEKAIYELGYEINARPDWVGIPARGILEILGHTP